MSDHFHSAEEKRVVIARWVDQYTARFDQELTTAWPDLADRLRERIATLSWYELTVGPGEDFRKKRIKPAVEGWVKRHVASIIEDATREFRDCIQPDPQEIRANPQVGAKSESVLQPTDVIKVLTLPVGLLVGGGAVVVAITTATSWLIFTTVVVNWPLLIAGLAVGTVLSWFGVINLAALQGTLQERFQKVLLPAVRDAVIDRGIEHKGQRIPSLKDQLKQQVRDMAETARRKLQEGSVP